MLLREASKTKLKLTSNNKNVQALWQPSQPKGGYAGLV
jgi:hypothetical protein